MNQLRKNIIITSTGHFLVHSMTMILPAILVILEGEFSVTLVQLGKLVTIQILFLGLGGFPAGILADRFGSRMVLRVYFAGLVISSLWLFYSTTFLMAYIGFGLLGLITGLYHPAGLKLVSHSPNVSRYMSYHGVSGSLGLAVGPIYGAWMANWQGWRTAYLILGGLALLGFIFSFFYQHDQVPRSDRIKLKFTFSRPQIIIITVAALWSLAHHGLFNFLPYYFKDGVLTPFNAVVISGSLTGFVLLLGIIGQLIGGRMGDHFQRKNVYIWVLGMNIPFLIMIAFLNGWTLIGIAGILGAINFMFQPIHNSLLADVTGNDQRGIIYGFSAGISFGIGSLAGIVGGKIGDIFSISHIFPTMAVFLIPAVILAIVLKKIL